MRKYLKKCPECGKVVLGYADVEGLVGFTGENLQFVGNDDNIRFAVIACPNCQFTDENQYFPDVSEADYFSIGHCITPVAIKYSRVAEKNIARGMPFKALNDYLTASWYTTGRFKEKCLLNVHDLILETIDESWGEGKLKKYVQLGFSICEQIGLDSEPLQKACDMRGIVVERKRLFEGRDYPMREFYVGLCMGSLLDQFVKRGMDDSEVKIQIKGIVDRRMSIVFDESSLKGG